MKIELSDVQKMLNWLNTKLQLHAIVPKAKSRAIKRGEVYWCNFGYGVGSEMQKKRPAVVIQNDIGNKRSGNTIVIPITHDDSSLPCTANITPQLNSSGETILDGQANASNIMCVSKARLGDYICSLTATDIKSIDEAIAKTIGLMNYYAAISQKLADKLAYIDKIKEQRNRAQDELKTLRTTLGLSDQDSIADCISEMKKKVDNSQQN
ncbi:MAG: type II toxin-antitoxin system PemK/MazF family toxin [Butyricicoccaceae bacterium]